MSAADDELDALIATRRPPGGWSAIAEGWTDMRMRSTYRDVENDERWRERALRAEQDADMLYAALEGERAQKRHEARPAAPTRPSAHARAKGPTR